MGWLEDAIKEMDPEHTPGIDIWISHWKDACTAIYNSLVGTKPDAPIHAMVKDRIDKVWYPDTYDEATKLPVAPKQESDGKV